MRVRHKEKGYEGFSSRFNTVALAEIIVGFDEGDMDSMFIREFDVQLSSKEWKDMSQAFKDHDLITDDYNTMFFEPRNEEDRARGYV